MILYKFFGQLKLSSEKKIAEERSVFTLKLKYS